MSEMHFYFSSFFFNSMFMISHFVLQELQPSMKRAATSQLHSSKKFVKIFSQLLWRKLNRGSTMSMLMFQEYKSVILFFFLLLLAKSKKQWLWLKTKILFLFYLKKCLLNLRIIRSKFISFKLLMLWFLHTANNRVSCDFLRPKF